MNCIAAHTNANTPVWVAAFAMSPCSKLTINRGKTGMMIPNATMSSATVAKMNANDARPCLAPPGCATGVSNTGGVSLTGPTSFDIDYPPASATDSAQSQLLGCSATSYCKNLTRGGRGPSYSHFPNVANNPTEAAAITAVAIHPITRR